MKCCSSCGDRLEGASPCQRCGRQADAPPAEPEDDDDRDAVDVRWWRQHRRAMGAARGRRARQAPVTGLIIAFTVFVFVFIQHGLAGVSPASLALQGGVLAPPYARPSQWLTGHTW